MSDLPEIIKVSDNKITIGKSEIFLTEENVVYSKCVGSPDGALARLHIQAYDILTDGMKGKINYLIDLNKAGKNSPEARREWQKKK